VTVVRVTEVADFDELGERWRDLEERAAPSFFQSWTWVGCLAADRFPDPVLVEATEGTRVVGFALFNRVRRWSGLPILHLGASGSAELDSPYVEQNGVLAEAGRETELGTLCLRAVASRYRLVLPGVDELALAAVRRVAGLVQVECSRGSPFIDLAVMRAAGEDYLSGRSANTRQQIRRSDRFYETKGPIELEVAESAERSITMLEEMAALHQTAWRARGRPGSFARPFFRRFHQTLVNAAFPRGEVMLLRVSVQEAVIGILYNFMHRGRMLAYQSGFAYLPDQPRAKPGLSCHHQAIRLALMRGLDCYDFLAGEDRYKRSLATGEHQQLWLDAGPFWSPDLLLRAVCSRLAGEKLELP